MVFERAADEVHAVGEQGGGEGVALHAVVPAPVESEAQALRAVDAAAGRRAQGIHGGVPAGGSAGGHCAHGGIPAGGSAVSANTIEWGRGSPTL